MICRKVAEEIKARKSWTNTSAFFVTLVVLQGCFSSQQLYNVHLGRTITSYDGLVQSPWTFVENDIGITLGLNGDRPMFEMWNNSTHNAVLAIDSSFLVVNQLPFALQSGTDCSLTGTNVLPPDSYSQFEFRSISEMLSLANVDVESILVEGDDETKFFSVQDSPIQFRLVVNYHLATTNYVIEEAFYASSLRKRDRLNDISDNPEMHTQGILKFLWIPQSK